MPYKDPEQRRAYAREWQRERRAAWIAANGPCARCGSTDRLEVDHVDPTAKEVNPRELWSLAEANPRRVAELAKCQVLCRRCHAEKSSAESAAKVRHPSTTTYTNGCRCEGCRKAHRDAYAEYQKRRRGAA